MGRLSPITREALDERQRTVLETIESGPRGKMGLVGPFGVYVRVPEVGDAVQNLGAAVRFGTALAENVKEVAICTVGAFYHAKFEFAAHERLAAKAGVAQDIISAIQHGETPRFEREDECLAHDVASQLLGAHRISDHTYARASQVLGEAQLIELVVTVGYYVTVSMTLNAFQVDLPEDMADPYPDHA